MKGFIFGTLSCVCILIGCSSTQSNPTVAGDSYVRAEELGIYTNLDTLQYREVPPEDDAAPLYDRFEYLDPDDRQVVRDFATRGLERDKAVAILESVDFDLLEEIASRPSFKVDGDWSRINEWPLPWIGNSKAMTDRLAARALQRAQDGDATGCMDDISRITVIADHQTQQGFMIGHMVHSGILGRLARTVDQISKVFSDDPENLQLLLTVLSDIKESYDFDHVRHELAFSLAYVNELAAGHLSLADISNGPMTPSTPPTAAETKRINDNKETYKRILVSEYVKFFEVWDDLDALEALQEDLDKRTSATSNDIDKLTENIIFSVVVPSMRQARVAELRTAAYARGMRIGVAATILKSQNREWPTLEEAAALAGVTSDDPFGGTLRYVEDEYGLFIYTVNEDGDDQGGQSRLNRNDPYDIVLFGMVEERFERGRPTPRIIEN